MKLFIEVIPVALFVAGYFFFPDLPAGWVESFSELIRVELTVGESGDRIYFATAVLMLAMLAQCGILQGLRSLNSTHLAALVIVWVAGGLTLLLKDPLFIKWKPTVFYWALAIGFLASHWIGSRTLVERMLSRSLPLDNRRVWQQLNLIWVGVFVLGGALNIYVAYEFPEDFWVQFKLYGLALGFPLIFLVAQVLYLAPHLKDSGPAR